MGQKEWTVCKKMTDVKLGLLYRQYVKPFNCVQKKLRLIQECYQQHVLKFMFIFNMYVLRGFGIR